MELPGPDMELPGPDMELGGPELVQLGSVLIHLVRFRYSSLQEPLQLYLSTARRLFWEPSRLATVAEDCPVGLTTLCFPLCISILLWRSGNITT
jgi:hypothetical protein